jgi:hypothetical protein
MLSPSMAEPTRRQAVLRSALSELGGLDEAHDLGSGLGTLEGLISDR